MKNKRRLFFTLLLVVCSLGILFSILLSNKESTRHNIAAAVQYETIEELSNNSQLIIKGKVTDKYRKKNRQHDNKTVTEKLYKIEVKKVLVNNTDQKIEKGMEIEVSHSTGFDIGGTTYDIVDPSIKELPKGKYILFLNKVTIDNDTFFVNNSPNNLYLLKGNKYINFVKNVKLKEITKEDLSKIN